MATETNDDFDYQRAWIELRDYVQQLRDDYKEIIDRNPHVELLSNWGSILACKVILGKMKDLRLEMVTVRLCMPDGERP